MNGRFVFLQEFFRNPRQIGSIIPSSRFLERRIVEAAGIRSARVVVELGPGTGGTTRAMLRAMAPDARLLSIEINPNLHELVCRIEDERLIAHLGSASDLDDILATHGLDAPDAIVSGIPFSTMNHRTRSQVLEAVASTLAENGRFVAYQMLDRVVTLCQPHLGPGRTATELLNIPPMRVYQWEKNGA